MNNIYGMRLRGYAPLCQPKDGFVERRDSNKYHDILVYNRELTVEELRAYEFDYIGVETEDGEYYTEFKGKPVKGRD